MLVWGGKDPNEIADFDIDWTLRLNGDSITNSNWSIIVTDAPNPTALVLGNAALFTAKLTKVWLSAGSPGFIYTLKNVVTTQNGDTLIEEVLLQVAVQ